MELKGEVEDLGETVKEGLSMEQKEVEYGVGGLSGEDDAFLDVEDENEQDVPAEGHQDEDEDEDEEMCMLKAMMSGHRSKKKVGLKQEDEVLQTAVHVENENENEIDDGEPMEYDNGKSRRRKNKKEKGRKNTKEATKGDKNGTKDRDEDADGHDNSHMEEKSSSHAFVENQTKG
ncbi:hypothetical protein Dsin_005692 [Dipteronia sinensis]|uniref:Uncharacterized protein n=1 Tax=Dipteronia sinensis TaxID=43782 RepID=A0AAE0AXT0_9ROSI|nr:hypothetical protein Dsin_005692 [Dipteronia sinensis]